MSVPRFEVDRPTVRTREHFIHFSLVPGITKCKRESSTLVASHRHGNLLNPDICPAIRSRSYQHPEHLGAIGRRLPMNPPYMRDFFGDGDTFSKTQEPPHYFAAQRSQFSSYNGKIRKESENV